MLNKEEFGDWLRDREVCQEVIEAFSGEFIQNFDGFCILW